MDVVKVKRPMILILTILVRSFSEKHLYNKIKHETYLSSKNKITSGYIVEKEKYQLSRHRINI